MTDYDFAAERAIIDSILAAVPKPEPPREAKGAAYWVNYFAANPIEHRPRQLPLKPVSEWHYTAGKYAKAVAPIRRRPWYLRQCVRCRPLIVPLQRFVRWIMK